MKLSVVILNKNQKHTLIDAIKSVAFADEILVLDDQSVDGSPGTARQLGARVISHALQHNFAAQRNVGLTQAKGDWVLFIDADEVVTSELQAEIKAILSGSALFQGCYIHRQDVFMGKILKYGETGHMKLLRLARRSAGQWERPVHEYWSVSGPVANLSGVLQHSPHTSLEQMLYKLNFYTDIEGRTRKIHRITLIFQLITYPVGKYIFNYLIKQGFRDGFPGLVMAWMMSLHSLMVRVKVYERSH